MVEAKGPADDAPSHTLGHLPTIPNHSVAREEIPCWDDVSCWAGTALSIHALGHLTTIPNSSLTTKQKPTLLDWLLSLLFNA